VLISLWSVHRDQKHWGDPDVFRPERFIDAHGQLIKDDWLLNFGVGKFVTLLNLKVKPLTIA
jgi:methyl farnesoate epoxidase/farnesoate epoxidase